VFKLNVHPLIYSQLNIGGKKMAKKVPMNWIISIVVALIVASIMLPIGLGYMSEMGSQQFTIGNTTYTLSDSLDSSVLTLLTVIVPLGVAISLLLYFIPRMSD
jgi:hypothetical protein